jgi:hypothetical protein
MTTTTKITSSIILFTILMTWPLLPFLASSIFTSNITIAAASGSAALGW